MSDFPVARILEFISNVIPFDALGEEELKRAISWMEIAYFPRGEVIILAGGDPSGHLFIIHSGSVKITLPVKDQEEVLVDVRGEGDVFGALSLLTSKKALFTVTAREDLLVFMFPADPFLELVKTNPRFGNHFSFTLARNLKAIQDPAEIHLGRLGGVEPFHKLANQMRQKVAELMSLQVLTCLPGDSVRTAARLMTDRAVGSIVIMEDSGYPLGLLTDTDLRSRIIAAGLSPEEPVERVMSHPVHAISHQALAFEAMLDMTRHGVHHLVVMEGEHMVGVISDHDIKVMTGSSPVGLTREIDALNSRDELDKINRRVHTALEMLFRLGSTAEYMMSLISEVIDRLTLKLFDITVNEMSAQGLGPQPAPFVWLALDGTGRREQAPPRAQTNALAFFGTEPDQEPMVREWFLGFSRRVNEGLESCGRPFCPLGVMAKESQWCQSESQWRQNYLDWVMDPFRLKPEKLGVFFDVRAVNPDQGFCMRIKKSIWERISEKTPLLEYLAGLATGCKAPLGFLRNQVVERDGGYTDLLELSRIMDPLVQGTRILALDRQIGETNTLARLSELARQGLISERLGADLRQVFNFVTTIRIAAYLEAVGEGRQPQDWVEPFELHGSQRKMFKESFSVIFEFQTMLRRQYLGSEDF